MKQQGDRTTGVTVGHLSLVACYQPLWEYSDESHEQYRREMDDHLAASSNLKWLIIGGDHNSHIGYGGHWDFADGTKGPFGMGRRDDSGTDFLQWCEDNNLCFADSFVRMEHRGTWFSRLQA